MQTTTLDYPYNARTTYTAVKHLLRRVAREFSGVDCDDSRFRIRARHGIWLSPFSESISIRVVATGTETCRVVIESSSRSILNLLNFGANRDNLSNLSEAISNEVYRLSHPIEMRSDHATIRIVQPEIKIKGK
ncbi:MAG: hypothetical protein ACI4AK_04865 [Lepagella sp.]